MNKIAYMNKFRKAQILFLRELRDGCNDCSRNPYCVRHEPEALDAILNPSKCVAFQELLQTLGLQKEPK